MYIINIIIIIDWLRFNADFTQVAQADAAVKYSTSAVDVCCCFTQVGQLVIYTGRSAGDLHR